MASTTLTQLKLTAVIGLFAVSLGCDSGGGPVERYKAPEFTLEPVRPSDKELSNENLKGKVVLLDFWATWCAPCRETMPLIQKIHDKLGPKGVTVIGVSSDARSAQLDYAKTNGFTYRFALDRGARTQAAFGFDAIPSIAVLSKTGQVAITHTGIDFNWEEFVGQLEALAQE